MCRSKPARVGPSSFTLVSVAFTAYVLLGFAILLVQSFPEGAVRLRGGYQVKSGALEVLVNSSWVPVSSDQWREEEGSVVCRQLGYTAVAELLRSDELCLVGEVEYALSGVVCSGEEEELLDCNHTAVQHPVNFTPAGITCADEGDARLVNRTLTGRGVVEVLLQGVWSPRACDVSSDPDKVCTQLGYEGGEWLENDIDTNNSTNTTNNNNNTNTNNSDISSGSLMTITEGCSSLLQCFGSPPSPCQPEVVERTCCSLTITWSASLSSFAVPTGYNLRYRASDAVQWLYISVSSNSSNNTITITSLKPATLYQIQSQAVNSAGQGVWSKQLWTTTLTLDLAPPNQLMADLVSYMEANISWTLPSMAVNAFITGFDIVVTRSGISQLHHVPITSFSLLLYSTLLQDLVPAEVYQVKARSVSSMTTVTSQFSSTINFTSTPPDVLLNASLSNVINKSSITGVMVEISWTVTCLDPLQEVGVECDELIDEVLVECTKNQSSGSRSVRACDGTAAGSVALPVESLSWYQCNTSVVSTAGRTLAHRTDSITTAQAAPQGFHATNISSNSAQLHWQYSLTTPLNITLRISAPGVTRTETVSIAPMIGEGSSFSYKLEQLLPGRRYDMALMITDEGIPVSLSLVTAHRAPTCQPLQFNISRPLLHMSTVSINFSWVLPPANFSDCSEEVIGHIIECRRSPDSAASLSYTLLLHHSPPYNSTALNTTASLSREIVLNYDVLSCHVTSFNVAGESPPSNIVTITFATLQLTGELERSFLSNPYVGLGLLVLVIVVVGGGLLIIFIAWCIRYKSYQNKMRKRRVRQSRYDVEEDHNNIYYMGELTEDNYVPMATSVQPTTMSFRRNTKILKTNESSLWIENPEASSFMPLTDTTDPSSLRPSLSEEGHVLAEVTTVQEVPEENYVNLIMEDKVRPTQEETAVMQSKEEARNEPDNVYDEVYIAKEGTDEGSSEASTFVPPPVRRKSLPESVNSRIRRPPPRRPTVPARPVTRPRQTSVTSKPAPIVIPRSNQSLVTTRQEYSNLLAGEEPHYSVPRRHPVENDPNKSPDYEVVLHPSQVELLIQNEGNKENKEEEEEEEKGIEPHSN